MKTGGMAKAKKYREGGQVSQGLRSPRAARARDDEMENYGAPDKGYQSMNATPRNVMSISRGGAGLEDLESRKTPERGDSQMLRPDMEPRSSRLRDAAETIVDMMPPAFRMAGRAVGEAARRTTRPVVAKKAGGMIKAKPNRAAGFKKGGKVGAPKVRKYQAGGPVGGMLGAAGSALGQLGGRPPTGQQQFIDSSGPQLPGGGPNPNAVPFMPTGQVSGGSLPPSMPNGTTAPAPPGGYSGPSPNAVPFMPRPAPSARPAPRPEPNVPRGSRNLSPDQRQMLARKMQDAQRKMAEFRSMRGTASPAVMKKGGKVVAKKKGGMIKAKRMK